MIHPLSTIGHSDCDQKRFVELLHDHSVDAVADVRSSPYSRRNPQFNRESLVYALREARIRYVFMGNELGARREEPECYIKGKARYDLIAQTVTFENGIRRVRAGLHRFHVALLCAEHDPITCHRMILICKYLRGNVNEIRHIRRDGTFETNEEAEKRLLSVLGLNTAFANTTVVDQAYALQAERIAYTDERNCCSVIEPVSPRSSDLKLL
jgi:uncharacterized protein (DUF488 family)